MNEHESVIVVQCASQPAGGREHVGGWGATFQLTVEIGNGESGDDL